MEVISLSKIFEQGEFSQYANIRLDGAQEAIIEHYQDSQETTVFISHKHDDLNDLKGVLGFLENTYNVKVYIDSQDLSMPKIASATTAYNIKQRIKQCDKFILLATNNAIESKWCNWELGFGDAQKYPEHIALFPMKPEGTLDSQYKGSEYMSIYPYITYSNGNEFFSNGSRIYCGYYVVTHKGNKLIYQSLAKWFSTC